MLESNLLRISDKKSSRIKDDNGYLIIKNNPIAKAGVFKYLLSEIFKEKKYDDTIVNVYRDFEDLCKIKDSFANKPIKFNHKWVGEGEEEKQADGVIGSIITIDEDNLMLRADLIIFNPDLIRAIEDGLILELSPGYFSEFKEQKGRFNGLSYDFIQRITCVNHLAVVKEGRSGHDLRINDNKNNIKEKIMSFMKSFVKTKDVNEENKVKNKEINDNEIDEKELKDKLNELKKILSLENIDEENEKILKEFIKGLLISKVIAENTVTKDEKTEKKEEDEEIIEIENKEEIDKKLLNKEIKEFIKEIVKEEFNKFKENENIKSEKVNDAYNEVRNIIKADFNIKGKNEDGIYKFGYEVISGKTLDENMDPKTAFKLACKQNNKQNNLSFKIEDNSSNNDIENLINKM